MENLKSVLHFLSGSLTIIMIVNTWNGHDTRIIVIIGVLAILANQYANSIKIKH